MLSRCHMLPYANRLLWKLCILQVSEIVMHRIAVLHCYLSGDKPGSMELHGLPKPNAPKTQRVQMSGVVLAWLRLRDPRAPLPKQKPGFQLRNQDP